MTDDPKTARSPRATNKSRRETTMASTTVTISTSGSSVPGVPKAVMNQEETIATHIAAALAAFGGAMALLHPGFHLPAEAQEIVVPVAWVVAGGLELFNLVTKRGLKKAVIAQSK
jgi:hypothetical protein